jgi:hypothetical protein
VVPDNSSALAAFTKMRTAQAAPADGADLAAATVLKRSSQSTAGHVDFFAVNSLDGSNSADYYRLQSPQLPAGQTQSMTVLVWTTDGSGLMPRVTVYDATGQLVAADVTWSAQGTAYVRLDHAGSQKIYYVAVDADPSGAGAGAYSLDVQFGAPPSDLTTVGSGTLTDAAPQQFRSVVLPQEQLLRLEFDAAATAVPSATEVTLYDANGVVIYDGVLFSGQSVTLNLFLAAGSYTVRFAGATSDGSPLSMGYAIRATSLGDPIGPALIDPNNPPPRQTDPSWLDDGLLKIYALFNPYGRPYGQTMQTGT